MKKIVAFILLLGLLTGCEIPVLLEDVNPETNYTVKSTCLIVPDDYATIQEAFYDAEDGDIIIIKEGISPECKHPHISDYSKLKFLSRIRYYFNRFFKIKNEDQNEKRFFKIKNEDLN